MKCPSCGKENPSGEQYCLDCGSDLSAAPAAGGGQPAAGVAGAGGAAVDSATTKSYAMSDDEFQRMLNTPPAQTKCPHCGATAPGAGTFCDNCGEPLAVTPAAASGATPAATPEAASAGSVPQVRAQVNAAQGAAAPATDQAQLPTQAIGTASPASGAPATPSAPAAPAVRLEFQGPSSGGNVSMSGDELKIGRRDADAGIYPDLDFDGNDIVMEAGDRVHAVSRRHARIFRDGDRLKFEDLGSTNGSTLNGAAVLAHDPQPLKDDDKIVLGRTCRITVHVGGQTPPGP